MPFAMSTAAVPLRRNRDLRKLLISQSLSALGDAFALVAIPLLVLHATHSVAQMGLVTGVAGAAGLTLIRLRLPAPVRAGTPAAAQRPGGGRRLLQDLLEGAGFLWRTPVLRALTVALTIVLFFTTGLNDLIVYDVVHGLRHSDSAAGAVMAAGTVGTFLGSALVAWVRRRAGFGGAWIGGTALGGLAMSGLGVAGNLPAVAVLAAAAQMCIAVGGIASMSLRQEITPGHLLGRVTAAFWTVHNALGPAGAALLTAAAAGYGAGPVLAGSGLAVTLTALAAVASPIRRAGRGHGRPHGGRPAATPAPAG